MEDKGITLENLNFTVLKAQNQNLIAKVNTLKARLKQLEQGEEDKKASLLNCSLSVDTLTSTLRRSHLDPLQEYAKTVFKAIEDIGAKLKQAFLDGTKPNCEEQTKIIATQVMTLFQALLKDRLKFNETLAGKEQTQSATLKDRCELLEKEKTQLLLKVDEMENEFSKYKQDTGNAIVLKDQIESLKLKTENLTQRFERLSKYNSASVEDLLSQSPNSTSYPCICGADMLNHTRLFLAEKAEEIKNYIPKVAQNTNNNINNGVKEHNPQTERMVNELQQRNEQLTLELNKSRITKVNLDHKFLESACLDDLTKQLIEVINYSMFLKQHLDTTEKSLLEIQSRRVFELNDLMDRFQEEKSKLQEQNSQLQKELVSYKERNLELVRLQEVYKQTESARNVLAGDSNRDRFEELSKQVESLTSQLAQEKEKVRHEHHKVYKYQKEVQNIKDNHYEELLKKYATCDNTAMRHSRHTQIFNKVVSKNEELQLGWKDELDELLKYINSREEKINYIEGKWKKSEKELDSERKQCQTYMKEIEAATIAYSDLCKENENMKKELEEMNVNFSKVCKEKTADKLVYESENGKLQVELKKLKELVPTLNETITSLKKSITAKEKHMQEVEKVYETQKNLLVEVNEEKNKQAVDLENQKRDKLAKENQLQAIESVVSKVSKETSELRTQLSEKTMIIEQYFKNSKLDSDIDLKNLTETDYLTARIELKKLRKQVICSVCNKRDKDRIIDKCYHRFCNECLTTCLNHRERKCPVCGVKFSHHDVKTLFQE